MAKSFSVSVNIGGKVSPSLGAAVRQAGAMVSGLARGVQATNIRTRSAINEAGRSVASAGRKIQDAGRSVTTGLSAPTGILAFSAGKMAFEFEKAGNELQALGDATDAQRTKFEGFANELNKKYPQSLAEIIKTGNEMLKGGFSFDQMTGAIDQTLATAILGKMEPNEVGDMMARTINSFQMPMKTYEDAMRSSTQVSDRMTYAAVKTTASLRDMGEMYRYVGGAVSATGGNIDQATAFAMAFAKNGTVGSEAGVALRSAIVRMVKMPDKGHATLARIGMDLNKFVGGKQALTSDRLLNGLQAGGIDASGIKGQIDKLLANKKLADAPIKLQSAITQAVQSHIGSSGAFDAKTIADNVNDSLTMAGSNIDLMGFFRDLKKKIDTGQATMGDVASILEGRHFSRYVPLLQSNLDGIVSQIQGEAGGYTQDRYKTMLKGPVGAIYELDAALEKLSVTLGRIAFPGLAKGFSKIADGLRRLSEANPTLLTFGTYAGLAAIALGPLMWVAGGAGRAIGVLVPAILNLGRVATLGLASQLVAVAGGVRAIAIATTLGVAGKLRTMATGLVLLGVSGGSGLVLASFGSSLASFGKAVLMFPVTALRGIGSALMLLVANPVGIVITAIVAAFASLGVWVYNNWEGIKGFFSGFAEGFSSALGPQASGWLNNFVSGLSQVWQWVSNLLGPISATNEEWKGWGATVGGIVAGAVNAAASGIERVIGLFKSAYEGAVALGSAIASIGSGSMSTPSHVTAGVSRGGLVPGGPARTAATPTGPEIAGARARGGPVRSGLPYLVGERGPEIMVPDTSGRIEPNSALRRFGPSPEAIAHASGRPTAAPRGTNHVKIEITVNGGDPREVEQAAERAVYRAFSRLESEQRASLSD